MLIYFGDDTQNEAAGYLSGVLMYYGIDFVHVNSTLPPPADFTKTKYSAFILSDYRSERFSPEQLQYIKDSVEAGSGLLMLGGWSSYHGQNGKYNETVLAEVLPVIMKDSDDRLNFPQSAVVYKNIESYRENNAEHPITGGLPWHCPPCIGGCNRVMAKDDAQVLLSIRSFNIHVKYDAEDNTMFLPGEKLPLLIVGQYGKGKTAALATDAAPHWVGGFVDWGTERITQQVTEANEIEVGADYAKFFKQLVEYVNV
ncbi:MAG: glutamine amidotransferase [Planctomycetaceae bacterium]|nr:glutamine amidotransferase [Planctomycetaceae bacterium]